MSIHKDKRNNTWYVKYKNSTKRGFKTKTEAKQYEAKLKLSLIHNADCINVYFHDVASDYVKYQYERYQNKNISYGTYLKIKNVIETIIIPHTDNQVMNKLSELHCRKFSEIISSLDYSTVHKNYVLNVYKAIFKRGIQYYKLSHNPSIIIEPLKKSFEEKMNKKAKEKNVWTMEEFEKFISCVDKEIYKQLFIVLYYTGLRIGEALALQWSDFENNELHITKAITRKTESGKYELKETKNISSIRDVDVGKVLGDYLRTFKAHEMKHIGFREDWFIFGRTQHLPQTSIDRVKDTAIKKAGVKRIRLHDFRHSHASNLIANGINIVAVSRRLGHSDINITLSVYTHLLKKNELELTHFIDNSSQHLLNA